jgi:hypothetical protein
MIDHKQWRKYIIGPALGLIGQHSIEAEETLVAIMATESLGFSTLVNVDTGGVGPYGTTPEDFKTAISYINRNMDLRKRVYRAFGYALPPPLQVIEYNLQFATLVAYFYYKEKVLAFSADIETFYNMYYTSKNSVSKETFISNYQRFIGVENERHEGQGSQKGNGKKGIQKGI